MKIAIFNIYGEGKTSSAKITVIVLVSRVCYWTLQKSFIQTTQRHKAQNFRIAYFHSYHAAQTAIFNKICYEPLIQKHEFARLFPAEKCGFGIDRRRAQALISPSFLFVTHTSLIATQRAITTYYCLH